MNVSQMQGQWFDRYSAAQAQPTVTRIAPALAGGLTGRLAPLCARAVREARIQFAWQRFAAARAKAHRAHAKAS
jgi:hypothetical protein